MALIDAVANSIGIPLWRLFGGVTNTITTDITVQFLPKSFYLFAKTHGSISSVMNFISLNHVYVACANEFGNTYA